MCKSILPLTCSLALGLLMMGKVSIAAPENSNASKPWLAQGKVTDSAGQPVAGAEITAHCGWGTLLKTGTATSAADGTYELRFGPGIIMQKPAGVQAATISVHKPGFFETNLYRQGDLVAGYDLPDGETIWGKKQPGQVFLPGQPKRLDFVLRPAARLQGKVHDATGKPLANKRIGLTGDELPPSSSVLQEKKTNVEGGFDFEDVPVGYRFKLYIDDGRSDWRKWPSAWVKFEKSAPHHIEVRIRENQLEITGLE